MSVKMTKDSGLLHQQTAIQHFYIPCTTLTVCFSVSNFIPQTVSQYMLLWSILPCRNTDTVCLCTVPFSLNGFVPQHALLESLAEDPLRLISLRLLSQLGEKQDKETMWQSISTIWRASAPKMKSTSSWDETTTNAAHSPSCPLTNAPNIATWR